MKITPIQSYDMSRAQYKQDQVKTKNFEEVFKQAKEEKKPEELKKVCKEFESVLMNMMLKSMRSTVHDGGWIQKSHGREIFESMLDEKMAQKVSEGEGMGLSKELYKQLSKYL